MANTAIHSHPRPRRARASEVQQPRRDDAELTAQPHVFAGELGSLSTPEDTLSLYPEDLGSHFLSEAVEQGDLSVRDSQQVERALLEDAEMDDGPVSASEVTLWTRILERAAQDDALLDQLEEAALLEPPEGSSGKTERRR